MKVYNDLVRNIIDNGYRNPNDRTGVGRCSIFSTMTRFNIKDGFPMITCRKTFFRTVKEEMLWFIRGSQDNQELLDKNVNIWTPWVITEKDVDKLIERFIPDQPEEGKAIFKASLITEYSQKIGPLYGKNWRDAPSYQFNHAYPRVTVEDVATDKLALYKKEYEKNPPMFEPVPGEEVKVMEFIDYVNARYYQSIDQLQNLMVNLRDRPYSARHVVSSVIPEFIPFETLSPQENILLGKGALFPCHAMFQCFVFPPLVEGGKKRISLQMYQRSVDTMVGASINIPSYALLLSMIAHCLDYEVDEFIYTTGDTHLYLSHIEKAEIQIARTPLPLPKLWLNPNVKDLFSFTSDDIRLEEYQYHDPIKYEIAV